MQFSTEHQTNQKMLVKAQWFWSLGSYNDFCLLCVQISEYRSKAAGITKLIECLCRSDKENWPKSLQLALDNTGYYNASELWDMREGKAWIVFVMLFSYFCAK